MLARGDGQGRQTPSLGPLSVYLIDPFSLKAPGDPDPGDIIVPAKATLMFDLAVTLANGTSRIYGNNTAEVGPAPAPGRNASRRDKSLWYRSVPGNQQLRHSRTGNSPGCGSSRQLERLGSCANR